MSSTDTVCVGLVWRGDPHDAPAVPADTRFTRIFEELTARGANAVPVIYADEVADAVRDRLLELDGAVVWVDPIVQGEDRAMLDALLRGVAGRRCVRERPSGCDSENGHEGGALPDPIDGVGR